MLSTAPLQTEPPSLARSRAFSPRVPFGHARPGTPGTTQFFGMFETVRTARVRELRNSALTVRLMGYSPQAGELLGAVISTPLRPPRHRGPKAPRTCGNHRYQPQRR